MGIPNQELAMINYQQEPLPSQDLSVLLKTQVAPASAPRIEVDRRRVEPAPIVFEDRYGRTELKFSSRNIYGGEGIRTPGHEIGYAHNPWGKKPLENEFGNLAHLMGQDFGFWVLNVNGFSILSSFGDHAIIAEHALLAKGRESLLCLAHEIGHTHQQGWVDKICSAVAGRDLAVIAELKREMPWAAPHIDELIRFAASNENVLAELDGYSDPRETPLGIAFRPIPFLGIALKCASREAYAAVNSLAEAMAWVRAFQLVEEGHLHPGMSRRSMVEFAVGCLETYDRKLPGMRHVATLHRLLG